MGLPLLPGRSFRSEEEEVPNRLGVVIIDVSPAERLFGSQDPIGTAIELAGADGQVPRVYRVAGVSGGVRDRLHGHAVRIATAHRAY